MPGSTDIPTPGQQDAYSLNMLLSGSELVTAGLFWDDLCQGLCGKFYECSADYVFCELELCPGSPQPTSGGRVKVAEVTGWCHSHSMPLSVAAAGCAVMTCELLGVFNKQGQAFPIFE